MPGNRAVNVEGMLVPLVKDWEEQKWEHFNKKCEEVEYIGNFISNFLFLT